jgi:hypothetical protein
MSEFEKLLSKLGRTPQHWESILALDPGETTGWATCRIRPQETPTLDFLFGQLDTSTIKLAVQALEGMIEDADLVICEDYRVYSWKSDQHKWANLHTPKLVGAIQTLCWIHSRQEPVMQMAIEAKDFCTDDKLQDWGLYSKGGRHARDAIRHLCSYLLFSKDFPKNSS